MRKREWEKIRFKNWDDCTRTQKKAKLWECVKGNTLFTWAIIGKDRQHYYVNLIHDKSSDLDKARYEFYNEYMSHFDETGLKTISSSKDKIRYITKILKVGDFNV